jgi:hypothetical protein
MQAISRSIEGEESIFHELRNLAAPEPTSSPTSIKHLVTKTLRLGCYRQPSQRFPGQAVGEPKSDELNDLSRIEMRQISSRVPALVFHATTLLNGMKMRHWSGALPAKI